MSAPDPGSPEDGLLQWVQLLSELDALGLREHEGCPAEAEISELFSCLGCNIVDTIAAIVQRCSAPRRVKDETDGGGHWIEEHNDYLLARDIQDRDEEEAKERTLRDLQFAQELAAQEIDDPESLALARQLSVRACEDDEKSIRAAAEMMRELVENDVMSSEDGLILANDMISADAEEKVSRALAEQLEHQFQTESLSQQRADEIFAEREQARWAQEEMESRRRANRSPIEAAGSGGGVGRVGGGGEEPPPDLKSWDELLLAIEVEKREKLEADRLYALRMQSQLESQQYSEEEEEVEKREKDRLLAELWQREEERERERELGERDAESAREIARLQREEGWIGSSSSSSSSAADGSWSTSTGEGLFSQIHSQSGLEAVEAARRAEKEKKLQEYDTSYRPRPEGSTSRNPAVTDVHINTLGWTVIPSPPTISPTTSTARLWPDPAAPAVAPRRPRPLCDAPLYSSSAPASAPSSASAKGSSGGSAFNGLQKSSSSSSSSSFSSSSSSSSSSSQHKTGSIGTVVITGSSSSASLSSASFSGGGGGGGGGSSRGHTVFVDTNPPRPLAAGEEQTDFDPFVVVERIDMRRLRALLAELDSFKQRREDEIGELKRRIDEGEKNWDGMLKILQKCVLIERILLAYQEVLFGAEEDEDGCCRLEVTYILKDHSKKGRLFAVAENVKLDGTLEGYDSDGGRKKGKVDKTTGLPLGSNRAATLQSMPKDLRAPLVGSFAYDVDCANSEVRILISLATKLKYSMPTLQDYFNKREEWLLLIMETFGLTREAAKRLPTIIISGGQYTTWERNHATNPNKRHGVDTRAIKEIKDFAQKLQGELVKFVGHCRTLPRFTWLENEERKLIDDGDGRNHEKLLLGRVVQSCEAEVLSILHKKFHDEKWHVRAKVFDGLITEPSDLVKRNAAEAGVSIDEMLQLVLRLAEESCSSFGWNVKLEIKPLFGLHDAPVDSIVQAKRALHL